MAGRRLHARSPPRSPIQAPAAALQLVDFSAYRIPRPTRVALLPLHPAAAKLDLAAEYFSEQLLLAVSRDISLKETFRLVERQDLQKILDEMELQLSGIVDETQAVKVGAVLGAEMLVHGAVYKKENDYELFLKLVRVQTGEILSVTKPLVDGGLGP